MQTDQSMIAAGVPFSEAYPMRRDMEKEIAMGRMEKEDFSILISQLRLCADNLVTKTAPAWL